MSEIDWDLAPEYASHGRKTDIGVDWYKVVDGVFCYLDGGGRWNPAVTPMSSCEVRPAVKAWTGEGLPPVGTVCEFRVEEGDWRKCEVIAHKEDFAVCWIHCNKIFATKGASVRPIRTPEQIKADERLHQVRNALTAIHAGDKKFPSDLVRGNIIATTVEAMIDDGYRRFEITDDSDPA
jgi:hypothetical protein